jgi:hypothetical protein
MTFLPTDNDGRAIPAMRLRDGGAHAVTSSGTSARNTKNFNDNTKIVSVYATQDVYLKFGDDTVIATTSDHFFPAGVYYDFAIGGGKSKQAKRLAVLQVSAGGTIYISEKE